MSITIKDIAARVGVSHTTVSRALNNSSLISANRRKEIQRIAKEMNYSPNIMARGLNQSKSYTIGVVVNYFENTYSREIFAGAENIAEQNNYVILFGDSRENPSRELKYVKTFLDRGVDGLIVYPVISKRFEEGIRLMQSNKTPFILVNNFSTNLETDYVVCDLNQAAQIAVDHLISLNHSKILFIGGKGQTYNSENVHGFKTGLMKNNVSFKKNDIYFIRSLYSDYHSVCEEFQSLVPKLKCYSAVILYSDELFPAFCHVSEANNLFIPDDLSVIGMGNVAVHCPHNIPLTTIHFPKKELGEIAMKTLLTNIENPIGTKYNIVLQPELIVRNSCRAI